MTETMDERTSCRDDDLLRKYGGGYGGERARKQKVCDGCNSKIYGGDTVYLVDRYCYCSECVEETEYDDDNFG
jgi:hypothetical protein